MEPPTLAFWSRPAAEVLAGLETTPAGLSAAEAASRLTRYASRRLVPKKRTDAATLLLSQFSSPIVLLLLGATAISLFLGDTTDAAIILAIVVASGLLGFWQERGAAGAVEKLLAACRGHAQVLRGGRPAEVPLEEVVPGDVVAARAPATTVPGDCLLLEARDLFVDEAALTGETFPAEKAAGRRCRRTRRSAERTQRLFLGTHVVSGTATALVVRTGARHRVRRVSADRARAAAARDRIRARHPPLRLSADGGHAAAGARHLRRQRAAATGRCWTSFLFSLALAVGLTPQLLPAIVSVNLAHGARADGRARRSS